MLLIDKPALQSLIAAYLPGESAKTALSCIDCIPAVNAERLTAAFEMDSMIGPVVNLESVAREKLALLIAHELIKQNLVDIRCEPDPYRNKTVYKGSVKVITDEIHEIHLPHSAPQQRRKDD